ncbi:hypothetical protein FRC09_001798 [Ceratobasidium sp. 395]|nr:hypothetical protein FRC09_001798 [Ceratobasidium sp. 395]
MEIVSRQQPYAYIPNEAAVITAIIIKRQSPKRPEDTIPVNSQPGDALWTLLESCWSWDPKDRPEAQFVVREFRNLFPLQKIQKTRLKDLQVKATALLDCVTSRKGQDIGGPFTEDTLGLEYSVDDLMDLLSKIRELGIDVPETARLELLTKRVRDFRKKKYELLLKLDISGNTSSLARLEELAAIGKGLRLRSDDVVELERLVARLTFVRELQMIDVNGLALDQLEEFVSRGGGVDVWPDHPLMVRVVARLQVFRDLHSANVNGLTLDQVEELMLRGQGVGVSSDYQAMAELARKAASGRQWMTSATAVLAQFQPEMKDIDQLLASAHSVPTLPDILGKLTKVWLRGREHEKEVEARLKPSEGTLVRIDGAIKVATTALDKVYFPAAEQLRALSIEAWMREESCKKITTGLFEAEGNATVLDEIQAMRNEGKAKFAAFKMPRFEDVVQQLAVHDEWVSRLPAWMRSGLSAFDLDSILRDVTGDKDAVCVPPTNEACTCICVDPVVVGTEVAQCDHCLVRFHAKCIEGLCPFCDDQTWNSLIGEPPTFKRQYLDSQYNAACSLTRHYSLEYRALGAILYNSSRLTKAIIRFIKQLGRSESPDPAAVPQIRHFMRKLYRLQVEISARPEVFAYGLSLAHLHRQMTMRPRTKQMARQKPKLVFNFEVVPLSPKFRCRLCNCSSRYRPDSDSDFFDSYSSLSAPCIKCRAQFHEGCIAFCVPTPFVCPFCLLKDGESYGPVEVRVTYHDYDPEENTTFVDVKACLDSYSWKVIRRALPPSVGPTITVKLFLFIPGTNPNIKRPEPMREHESPAEGIGGVRDVVRLERIVNELRGGLAGGNSAGRRGRAKRSIAKYSRELERIRAAATTARLLTLHNIAASGKLPQPHPQDSADDDDFNRNIRYRGSPTSIAYPITICSHVNNAIDYFAQSRRAPPSTLQYDTTPELSQAPESRVPAREAPQQVRTSYRALLARYSIQARWEPDDAVGECRECRRRFAWLSRKHPKWLV